MLKNWLQIFLHHIKNNKLFTSLNILGLSVGIAGLIFATLYWNDEQSYNAWNPENEHVFQVINDVGEGNIWNTNPAPLNAFLKSTFSELESHCYLNTWYFNEIIEYNGRKELIDRILDSQNTFFSFFPFEFIKGNAETALQDNTSIALSETTAKRIFKDEDPLGKQVLYSGRNLVVRGVYKLNKKSSYAPKVVTNLIHKRLDQNKDLWGNYNFGLLLKLKNPSESEHVSKKIENLFIEHKTKNDAKNAGLTLEEYIEKYGPAKVILEPLKTARLHSIMDGYPEGKGNYQFLLIMVGLSILILILSIVNYVNLATANAIKRAKEVGVRKIIGASKVNIIKQFIFETILLGCFSILLALVIVELSLPYYNNFLNKELLMNGSQFYLQLIAIFITVIIVAGILPSIYVSNFETLKVLKGNFGRSKSGVWLRNGMLILQFAIASFFIIGSYIVYQQVDYMNTKKLGFEGKQVLSINFRRTNDEQTLLRYYTIKQELLKMKGVKSVSTGVFTFGEGARSSSSFSYNDISIQGENMAVDFEMLDMMKIKIAEGRNLSPNFSSDTINTMLINKTTAKMMKEPNPIGKEINWNDNKLKIVGIVEDFHIYGPQIEIPPMVFFHMKTIDWMMYNMNEVYVKIEPENMKETIANLEEFWTTKVDTKYPFSYDFVDKKFARTYETYVKQKDLFSLLNIVVIIIALFGLFALATYSIERRMKEIAIRKTLGAETQTLLKELSKQYIIFCVIGFLIALFPAYYLLQKWLENFAFRISISIIPFTIGFVVLAILTLIVVLSRAYEATRVDVLTYLKYE